MYPLSKLTCINCKRIIVREYYKGNARTNVPKVCPGCSKPIASRASNRKMRRSK